LESVHLMGRKERRERAEKRENYATRHSAEKRKETLIAVAVIAVIAVIVGYASWMFLNMTETAPGGPENAGALGSAHENVGIIVNIFGDKFDFTTPAYQIKSSWIHFEGGNGYIIHKHATGVTMGFFFDSLSLELDDQCFVFKDGRNFCTNEEYSLKFLINGEQVSGIRDYVPENNDAILISYGAETPEELEGQLLELVRLGT